MKRYKENISLEAFGLQNSNSICYFNSALQSLLSCSCLMDEINSPNLFLKSLKSLLGPEKNNMHCWNCLNTELLSQKISNFSLGNQNCVAECLDLIIQCLPNRIQELFYHRTTRHIMCETCDIIFSEKIETDIIFKFTSHIINPDKIKKQKSELDIQCKKCQKNKSMVYSTTMIPEILTVMFLNIHSEEEKEEKKEEEVSIPEILHIQGRNETLIYRAVAYVNHYGSQNGGHYISYCLRKGGWYMLNDAYVSEAQFSPDKNTYIILYHYT